MGTCDDNIHDIRYYFHKFASIKSVENPVYKKPIVKATSIEIGNSIRFLSLTAILILNKLADTEI